MWALWLYVPCLAIIQCWHTIAQSLLDRDQPVQRSLSLTGSRQNITDQWANSSAADGDPQRVLIHVALIVPQNDSDYGLQRKNSALRNSGGAISLALLRLQREQVLPSNLNFTFEWRYEKCQPAMAVGYTYKFITESKADLLIATPCTDVPPVIGFLTSYYSVPLLVWGQSMVSALSNSNVYPTLLDVVPNYRNMARTLCDAMSHFNWTVFGLIFQSDLGGVSGGCLQLSQEIDIVVNNRTELQMSYRARIFNMNGTDTDSVIEQIRLRARIVVVCFDDVRQQRKFALKLFDGGLKTNDYVYLFLDFDMTLALDLNKPPFWQQIRRDDSANIKLDGRDGDAEAIGRLGFFFHLDITTNISDYNGFYDQVMAKMKDWPWYCTDCGIRDGENASIYSPLLYDAFYNYGLALSDTINQSNGKILPEVYRNGSLLAKNSKRTFLGMTGTVRISSTGKRQSIYALSNRKSANELNRLQILYNFAVTETSPIITVKNQNIWTSRGGVVPLAVPKCGFDGNDCQLSAFDLYKGYIISAIVVFTLIVLGSIVLMIYMIHVQIRERKKAQSLWQIPFMSLTRMKKADQAAERSQRSLASSGSSSRFTVDTEELNSKHFVLYKYQQEKCIVCKHGPATSMNGTLTAAEMAELKAMRFFDHENLNRFYGLSMDGPMALTVWKFCSRGSLRDVLGNNTLTKDAVFIHSIIWELCEGLNFLHNSPIQCHGNLKSANCLIDERWQVKISYFGMVRLRKMRGEMKTKDLLWKAPEQLRQADLAGNDILFEGTKQADVYTLALIFTEVINMRPCWDSSDDTADQLEAIPNPRARQQLQPQITVSNAEQIVYLVKKGGQLPYRPRLRPALTDLNPVLLNLIRECWTDAPNERPTITKVRGTLRTIRDSRNANLMDHVFNMLEQYATKLEEEVEERTKELVEEKKKSDILLYRMLPKQVADRLKIGHSVEPEHFQCVTVFFSDVVGFTTLSGRLKPLQLVNLMNDLYTTLDSIINEHDVYKVETVGDGYLCVSGLPKRNGDRHASECADMALKFIRNIKNFCVPSMPDEQIRLRIGLHSGPCVAGVVGLSMPRYCLFGDTVNTASRMQSSSAANKIHISSETQNFLKDDYLLESRGEVIIKGKGVMETYWLLGLLSSSNNAMAGAMSNLPSTSVYAYEYASPESPKIGINRAKNAGISRKVRNEPGSEMMYRTYRDGEEKEKDEENSGHRGETTEI